MLSDKKCDIDYSKPWLHFVAWTTCFCVGNFNVNVYLYF